MSSSNSPCAACKFLRRKCTQECVFAPYFPPDNPQKFANVHKVFGASNVSKILNELKASQREEAVNSLAYEAESRLRDPVYGCVGLISILQHRIKQMQHNLSDAKKQLATYIGPQAMLPIIQPPVLLQHNMMEIPTAARGGQMVMQQQQLAGYEHQQQEIVRFNGGGGSVTATGFNQITTPGSSALALGSFDNPYYQIQTPQQHGTHPIQAQL
ncbi:LATERAL ORGAN BOUNDARIES DOMAIN GENE 36, ASYMMETRIC LEAVES 2-like 1 [Hibiscus trionum]|uniref:LATERAL ORGAN BOUNDARIES DOMAIN GENE 36, ASYMMETRIC LEAVES 2-like 1 n=1 Tax=Hibiscus trionum TaxID=183268 RepID=A0A9W7HG78_HIBTR|nr:LATERAL ORGAN BOUNDARIES DOMAIN GENE 36, ASYMMETRIC LEAVES 2-like 1 [Hibiscus trionum]